MKANFAVALLIVAAVLFVLAALGEADTIAWGFAALTGAFLARD